LEYTGEYAGHGRKVAEDGKDNHGALTSVSSYFLVYSYIVMQDPDLSTATTELRMLLKRFVNDQNNIIFDTAMLIDDANNDQLREWFRSLSLCISKVYLLSTS
jgi:hypothetical protein